MLIHAGGEWELWIWVGSHSAGGCQAQDANGIPNSGDFLNPVCVSCYGSATGEEDGDIREAQKRGHGTHTCCHRWYRMVGFSSHEGSWCAHPSSDWIWINLESLKWIVLAFLPGECSPVEMRETLAAGCSVTACIESMGCGNVITDWNFTNVLYLLWQDQVWDWWSPIREDVGLSRRMWPHYRGSTGKMMWVTFRSCIWKGNRELVKAFQKWGHWSCLSGGNKALVEKDLTTARWKHDFVLSLCLKCFLNPFPVC